ncbi:MAG TPA: hypothetical protein VGS07_11530 [Thermoanaerobaculia bacterium]|jgi:hypothetical protein|nr:hypothetical protein [Thermoanaerobaculia bacterium]
MAETRVQFEASVSEAGEGGPARLFVWIRRFQGGEELTGRYEAFDDLPRLDSFISRQAAAGEDTSVLLEARERFAEQLGGAA